MPARVGKVSAGMNQEDAGYHGPDERYIEFLVAVIVIGRKPKIEHHGKKIEPAEAILDGGIKTLGGRHDGKSHKVKRPTLAMKRTGSQGATYAAVFTHPPEMHGNQDGLLTLWD